MSAMNAKVSLDQLVFRKLYYRYKAFVTPSITILICLLLFWFLVVPEMQNWFALRDSATVDVQNLQVLNQNLALISTFDDTKLNATLATATNALPTDKDFAGILSSLQNAAAVAGTSLGDYSFQLGDLSGLDQQGKAAQLPVQLDVTLKGDMESARVFVTQLRQQLPLSDTVAISVSSGSSITVTVVFYYALLPKIAFDDTVPLPILGSADQALLDSLANGNNLQSVTLASSSATLQPTPTLTPSISPTPSVVTPTVAPSPVATSSAQ